MEQNENQYIYYLWIEWLNLYRQWVKWLEDWYDLFFYQKLREE